jgi:asparaginyl-tRNA synthetase
MKNCSIKDLLLSTKTISKVTINGWVRTFRANRFIALNDGSSMSSVQCVVDFENFDESILKK